MHAYYVSFSPASKRNVMSVGVTNDLERRIAESLRLDAGGSFTRHSIVSTRWLHVEEFQHIDEAIAREKEIKGWRRVAST